MVCDTEWTYDSNIEEDIVRATCSPCGHQGLFKTEFVVDKEASQ